MHSSYWVRAGSVRKATQYSVRQTRKAQAHHDGLVVTLLPIWRRAAWRGGDELFVETCTLRCAYVENNARMADQRRPRRPIGRG